MSSLSAVIQTQRSRKSKVPITITSKNILHNYLFLSIEDGDSGFSPSPTKSCPDTTDSSLVSSSSSPHEVPRMASRHSVISRKDNIILSPDGLAGFDDVEAADSQAKNCELSPNSMALRCKISYFITRFYSQMHVAILVRSWHYDYSLVLCILTIILHIDCSEERKYPQQRSSGSFSSVTSWST